MTSNFFLYLLQPTENPIYFRTFVTKIDIMDKFQQLKELLLSNRSYRRFDNSRTIDESVLTELVNLTRFCASGMNKQPLRYRLVTDADECARVYPCLKWAGYLKDWDGPEEKERPVAYLIQCLDTDCMKSILCDDGLQLEAITLGAVSMGLGACIIKAFNATAVAETLALPAHLEPRYVIALGYPVEKVVLEDMQGENVEYWRDSNAIHHVPKRTLDKLIIK
jgi:nitroreductase